MAEATAESLNEILPEELLLEILSRTELSNPLQLRCVCKLWKSLVLDPLFAIKYLKKSCYEIRNLYSNVNQLFSALHSQLLPNLAAVVPQQQEQEEENVDDDDGGEKVKEEKKEDGLKQLVVDLLDAIDKTLVKCECLRVGGVENVEIIVVEMLALKDRTKCLLSFVQVYES